MMNHLEGGRLGDELNFIHKTLGDGHGITSELFIQTPKADGDRTNVLNHRDFLIHLEALKLATGVTIEMYDT